VQEKKKGTKVEKKGDGFAMTAQDVEKQQMTGIGKEGEKKIGESSKLTCGCHLNANADR